MKTLFQSHIVTSLFATALLAPFASQAGHPISATSGKDAKPVVEEPQYQLQPIFTRYAKISDKVTISTMVRGSRNVDLQEAGNLESWGGDVEIVFPFLERFQLRINGPVYTNGHARTLPVPVTGKGGRTVTQKEENISLSGYGGVFDFVSLQLEAQILTEEKSGINLTASIGGAKMADPLRTNSVGRYNHAGEST